MKWYAVQENRLDAWDYGSDNYHTAVRMLKEQGHGLIAVIDENTDCCVEEIEFDQIEERDNVLTEKHNLPARFWEGEPADGDDYPEAETNIYGDEPLPFN